MNFKKIYKEMLKKCPKHKRNRIYLKRYIKFISSCIAVNDNTSGYKEKHHILPKAKYLWPEYTSFKKNPWNRVHLTARQHYIAHIMLAKAFGGAMWCALSYFRKRSNNHDGIVFNSRIYERMRVELAKYYSSINKKVKQPTDKEILSAHIQNANYPNFHKTNLRWINDGVIEIMTDFDLLPDYIIEGRIEDQKNLNRGNSKNTKGKIWVTDGQTDKMVESDNIPIGYNKGRYKGNIRKKTNRDKENNHAFGKKWFTNGVDTILIYPEEVPKGYRQGFSEKDKHRSAAKPNTLYNNGIIEIRVPNDEEPPLDFVKGRLKVKCVHCGMTGQVANMKRYHNDNCKHK